MSGEGTQQIQSRDLTTLPFLPLQIPDINNHLSAPPHNLSMGLWGICLNNMKACTLCEKQTNKQKNVKLSQLPHPGLAHSNYRIDSCCSTDKIVSNHLVLAMVQPLNYFGTYEGSSQTPS